MANSPARLFVDMDGTLAVFNPVDTLETLYQPGYFSNLEPQDNVVQAVKSIITTRPEIEVYILSAVLTDSAYAQDEKNEWLDRYLPEVDSAHRIFPPCGADKKDYIRGGVRDTDFLLDDYTQNLTLWHPPGQGIKLLNGINHTRGTWEYDRIRCDKSPEDLATNLVSVIHGETTVMDEKPEITRDDVLNELQNQAWNNVLAYSENYAMTKSREGFEDEWKEATVKAGIIDQMVQETTQQPLSKWRPQTITRQSEHVTVAGHDGTWYCIDSTIIAGQQYFLMEHEEWGDLADSVIIDQRGELVLGEVVNGFYDLQEYFDGLSSDMSPSDESGRQAIISPEREAELMELFWTESNDPETQEWREELTEAETAFVDQQDNNYWNGMRNIAKKILEHEEINEGADIVASNNDSVSEKPMIVMERYFIIKEDIPELKTYKMEPMYDEHPGVASFESTLGVPRPHKDEFLILKGYALNISSFSLDSFGDPRDFTGVRIRHDESSNLQFIEKHLNDGVIKEITQPEYEAYRNIADRPFFGKIEYLNEHDTEVFLNKSDYIKACREAECYDVPHNSSEITESEYKETMAAKQATEIDRQDIVEEVEYEYGGED